MILTSRGNVSPPCSDLELAPFGLKAGWESEVVAVGRKDGRRLYKKRGRRIQRCQGGADRPYSLDRKFEAPLL